MATPTKRDDRPPPRYVAELDTRARAVMRATGQLGPDELIAGGQAFAIGDRVLVKRNDARCDIRAAKRSRSPATMHTASGSTRP